MLRKILLMIENQSQSIKEAEDLIEEVKKSLEGRGRECCLMEGATKKKKDGGEREKRAAEDGGEREKRAAEDGGEREKEAAEDSGEKKKEAVEAAVFVALKERVKEVVRSEARVVEASGAASDLVKYLSDAFLSTVKNAAEKSDAEILAFVKSHESYIRNFIENECSKSISSCLTERIKAETTGNVVLFSSSINVTPPGKVKEIIISELGEKINIEQQRGLSECYEAVKSSITNVKSIESNGPTLDLFIKDLNTEQETLYTNILTDHLDGMEKVVFNLPTESQEINETISALKSNIAVENELSTRSRYKDELSNDSLYEKLKNLPKINPDFAKHNLTNGELIIALDNSLFGLEMDIRDNLFKTSTEPKPQTNFHQNSKKLLRQKFAMI